jgi:hypothetical protein
MSLRREEKNGNISLFLQFVVALVVVRLDFDKNVVIVVVQWYEQTTQLVILKLNIRINNELNYFLLQLKVLFCIPFPSKK